MSDTNVSHYLMERLQRCQREVQIIMDACEVEVKLPEIDGKRFSPAPLFLDCLLKLSELQVTAETLVEGYPHELTPLRQQQCATAIAFARKCIPMMHEGIRGMIHF